MSYIKPLVTLLDNTTELAGCRPCIQVGALAIGRQPSITLGDSIDGVPSNATTVGAPCPTAPTPGTPEVGGISKPGPIDTNDIIASHGISDSFSADVGGVDVTVTL